MLSRRIFSGCALCGALGLAIGQAQAQAPGGLTRTLLRQNDVAGTNHVTIQMLVELPPGIDVAAHTHPGHEGSYVIEGEMTLMVAGESPRVIKAGDSYLVAPGIVHGAKNGPRTTKLFATFVVEKGKPLASPA